jgi:hypothetical protein
MEHSSYDVKRVVQKFLTLGKHPYDEPSAGTPTLRSESAEKRQEEAGLRAAERSRIAAGSMSMVALKPTWRRDDEESVQSAGGRRNRVGKELEKEHIDESECCRKKND